MAASRRRSHEVSSSRNHIHDGTATLYSAAIFNNKK